MKMQMSNVSWLLISLLLTVICADPVAGQGSLYTVELPDADSGQSFILNVAKARIEGVPAGVKTEQELFEVFRKTGDIVYDVDMRIASGRCSVLDRQQVADLVGKAPSGVTGDRDVVENVKQGDYLLIKRMDGGHALLFLRTLRSKKTATVSWVLNSGGDTPFGQEEITAILEVEQPRRDTVQTGVATVRSLFSLEPTVFTFADGNVKTFPPWPRVRSETQHRQHNLLVFNSADIAYETGVDVTKVVRISSRHSKVLGRGVLADYAGRDVSVDLANSRKSTFRGEELAAGTIVALRTRDEKVGLIRIESAGTNELKFQWAYLSDGSSVFPKVAPLPDAVPTEPLPNEPIPVRDIKAETQNGLKYLVEPSVGMAEVDLKAAFQKAIADGADVNGPGLFVPTVLADAAWRGSKQLVELMCGATKRLSESQALHAAAYAGRLDICQLLIAKGADPSYRNDKGLTAFDVAKGCDRLNPEVLAVCQPCVDEKLTVHDAALLGKTNALKRVIAQGVDVNGYDSQDKTPLQYAAEAGHAEACEVLIAAGALVDKTTMIKDVYPMNLAVRAGRSDVVRVLQKYASKKQVVDALCQASKDGHQDIVEAIIQRTEDVPGLYREGSWWIDFVLRSGNKSLYSLLKNKAVPLPLWAAAVVGDTNGIAKAIQAGSEIDKSGNSWEESPLQAAVRSRQYDAAKLLLAAGANPSRKCHKRGGDTPLHDAVRDKDEQMIALLLQYKADVNTADDGGRTPLGLATEHHSLPVSKRLLDAGADAKKVGISYLDPDDDKDLIRLLRKHGAK